MTILCLKADVHLYVPVSFDSPQSLMFEVDDIADTMTSPLLCYFLH